MAESDSQAEAFEAEGRQAVVRLKMPREGKCRIDDLVRGRVEFDRPKRVARSFDDVLGCIPLTS